MNPANGDRVVYAILLVVESFNKGRFLKEPWGLICNAIVNQPTRPKLIYLLDILQPSNTVSILAPNLIPPSNSRTLYS